jgi:hypothetical protein
VSRLIAGAAIDLNPGAMDSKLLDHALGFPL